MIPFSDSEVLGRFCGDQPISSQRRADVLLTEWQSMSNPMDTTEVAVEQRLVGLFSATKTLRDMSKTAQTRKIIARPDCLADIEIVRDTLSRILDDVGGK